MSNFCGNTLDMQKSLSFQRGILKTNEHWHIFIKVTNIWLIINYSRVLKFTSNMRYTERKTIGLK